MFWRLSSVVWLLLAITVCKVDCGDSQKGNGDEEFTNVLNVKSKMYKDKGFRTKGSFSDKVIKYGDALLTKIKKKSCIKKGCSPFSMEWVKVRVMIADDLVKLHKIGDATIENTSKNLLSVVTFMLDYYIREKKKMDIQLLQEATLVAAELRDDGFQADMLKVFPELISTVLQKKEAGSDYQDGASPPSPVKEPENRLDYWREDNYLQKWHSDWHIFNQNHRPENEQHERFFNAHRQLMIRYYIERYIIGLPEVVAYPSNSEPFDSYYNVDVVGDEIPNNFVSSKETCTLTQEHVAQLERERGEIASFVSSKTHSVSLHELGGEVNRFYHGSGHVSISEDCSGNGVREDHLMFLAQVSARDPVFYRWHTEVERLAQEHMDTKPQYTSQELEPPQGIKMLAVEIHDKCGKTDELATFKETYQLNNNDFIRINHEQFSTVIRFTNTAGSTDKVIVRIFLALEEFVDTPKWVIDLDKFTHQLTGQPEETITRSEMDSAMTNYVRDHCKWPQHLFIPRGAENEPTKFRFIAFIHGLENQNTNEGSTPELSNILCGVLDQNIVVDNRDHAFPFIRKWSGLSYDEVLRNKNSVFGNVSVPIGIHFKGESYPGKDCTTQTTTEATGTGTTTAAVAGTTGTSDGNPEGFEPEQCFDSVCYFVSTSPVDRNEADRLCQENSMTLATTIPEPLLAAERQKNEYTRLWSGAPPRGVMCHWKHEHRQGYYYCDRKTRKFFSRTNEFKAVCQR